jgi:NitT/TauT family transport system ATP-binding protein
MSRGEIELRDVTLTFGTGRNAVTALQNLTLRLRPGEFLSILGPSGCGKSSLISAIAGFQSPQAGELQVDGEPVHGPGSDRGVVFQQPTLFPWKTVRENVEFGLKFRGVPKGERRKAVEDILHKVGLSEFARHYPGQLSGGMQQRVGLARVLVNRPRVMLMDEPFSALDAQTRLMMQELLLDVWTEFGMTVLFVTHDVDEAVYLGSRVAVLTRRPGRLKALFDVELPRPRTVDILVSTEFMKLKRNCGAGSRGNAGRAGPGVQAGPGRPSLPRGLPGGKRRCGGVGAERALGRGGAPLPPADRKGLRSLPERLLMAKIFIKPLSTCPPLPPA